MTSLEDAGCQSSLNLEEIIVKLKLLGPIHQIINTFLELLLSKTAFSWRFEKYFSTE